MCGIAVALDWPRAEEVVRAAVAAMRHRGDITDDLVSPMPGSAFCTRRLRIVDPEHNSQPATSWDGRILLAFNGEIYNHCPLTLWCFIAVKLTCRDALGEVRFGYTSK